MTTRTLVGRVVGTLSARPVAGSTLTETGDGTDFAIGGLGFKLAINDERPYERATAQFRKEQFDSAPNVGDQSLTGWWTRGQLSFHKGAGVKFYEVLDGEEVLNRFNTSVSVDSRKPGVVSLAPTAELLNGSALSGLTTNRSGRSEAHAAVTTGNAAVLIDGATTTALTLSTAGSAYAVASGSGHAFYATTNGVEQVPASGTSLTVLSAKDVAANTGVWWAKNRIFTVNTAGVWHAVAATGGALGAGTKVWDSGLPTVKGSWSLAEAPGAVFLAYGSQVFAISVNSDGTVPVLTAGTTVAELPNDETIQGLTHALGYLVICTSKGVRVGVTNGADVVIGPRILDGSFTSAVPSGGTVYLGGSDGAYAIDLTQAIPGADLTFAWFKWNTLGGTMAQASTGRLVLTSTGVFTVDTASTLAASGEVITGFHRFGTLEPKQFHSVKVRLGGDGGSIKVYRVMSDDSEVLLYTFSSVTTYGSDVTLGLSTPVETLALKFVLERDASDGTKGPELYGYQLKALPAPRRQRMIRVPLQLFDVEQRGSARAKGSSEGAWHRLRALEQMEESGGTHMFQDFRTGESGVAYIESVEHTGTTPPGPRDPGFGGFVWVTLRKVDS